jgi:hypothetical protein
MAFPSSKKQGTQEIEVGITGCPSDLKELGDHTDNQLAVLSVKEELEVEELDISLKECKER